MADTEPTENERSEIEEVQSQVNEALAKLSGPGEPLVAGGAALLLFVDVVGDLAFRDYSIPYLVWAPSLFIVIAVALHRFRDVALPVAYGMALPALALIGGSVMARELLDDLRRDVLDRGGATVLFALVAYVGGALLLVGAWQLWSAQSKHD
jgi:hypothetical protein